MGSQVTRVGLLSTVLRSLRENLLPLGLAHEVKLVRHVAQGRQLTWDDVAHDAGDIAVKIRREMEAMFDAHAPLPA